MKKLKLVFAIFFIIFYLLVLSFCNKDKTSLKKQIPYGSIEGSFTKKDIKFFSSFVEAQKNITKNKNIDKTLAWFSKDFSGPAGESYSDMKKSLVKFYKNNSINQVKIIAIRIIIEKNKALVNLIQSIKMSTSKITKKINLTNKIRWRKQNEKWKIYFWESSQN